MRKKILTVTIKDCIVQTFRAGGPGGQNQNKRDTAVRIIHEPSGARGESREERTQLKNKQIAFSRMAKSPRFLSWADNLATCKPDYDRLKMEDAELKIEIRQNGKWTEIPAS